MSHQPRAHFHSSALPLRLFMLTASHEEQIALLAPRATMASVSTFHAAAGTDDASWEDIMLPRGAREPPPVPRGPPLRYYLTTVSADDTSSVFDWSS
mmetsp:Transcript_21509/g.54172  ORF Transcript_21509/g.54172 Transcript_21509/m.54172 type:complete len:97 (-) Transcript_21509:130-420(-)